MSFFYTSEVSDSESSSCSDASSGSESPFLPLYIRKTKNDYKVINSERRFKKFNDKYKSVIDANDQWCQGVVPASCKDHPYVQWYRQGKRVSTPVEVKFQYAKLIGGVLGFNKRVDAASVVVGSSDAQRNGGEMIGMMEQEVLDESASQADTGSGSGSSNATTGFAATIQLMFKGGSALIESGRVADGERVLGTVASACVSQICEEDPQGRERDRKWVAVGDRLLEVLPQLGARAIIDTAFRILAELKTSGSTPAALQGLLPMLLDALGAVGSVEIVGSEIGRGVEAGGSITRTGAELKAYWVECACAYRWAPQASVAVSAVLREIALGPGLAEMVAARMLRQLHVVGLAELPPMVAQLLLFARGGGKRQILGGIFALFDALDARESAGAAADSGRWRALGDAEGAAMLHFTYGVKQDFELGDALVAHARAGIEAGSALAPFACACLLALARIHRFADAVTALLRTHLVRSIHDALALQAMPWAATHLRKNRAAGGRAHERLLGAVVARSAAYGWDQATQALVHVSLATIDHAAAAARRGTYSARACAMARRVCVGALRASFAAHAFVRGEIIGQVLARAAAASAEPSAQAHGHGGLVGLLRAVTADDLDAVRPFGGRLVDALDAAPEAVEQLLAAVAPLVLEDAGMRGALVLVLRKALFAHSLGARRAALAGLFALARSIAAALSDCRGAQRRGEALVSALLEVLALVRRCLTQQPEVRALAYERLALLLDQPSARRCAVLLAALGDVFRCEFAKHYCADRAEPAPVRIGLCVSPGSHRVVMPVALFLGCFAKLVRARAALDAGNAAEAAAAAEMADVCARFARAQLEDFGLNAAGDYTLSSGSGLRNHSTCVLVIGCLDACMEHALMHGVAASASSSSSSSNTHAGCALLDDPTLAMALFAKLARFSDILSARCLDDRNRRVIGSPQELSLMSLHSAVRVLRLLLPDAAHVARARASDGLALWSANHQFVRHLLEVALARVQRRSGMAYAGASDFGPGPASGSGSGSGSAAAVAPVPDVALVLEAAYIAFTGAIAHYAASTATSADAFDSSALPAYLKLKGLRGRSVSLLCCDLLLACISSLVAYDMLDWLAPTLMRATPDQYQSAATAAFSAVDVAVPPLGSTCVDLARLITRLRNAVVVMMARRPMLVKECVSTMAAMHALAVRLTEILPDTSPALATTTETTTAIHSDTDDTLPVEDLQSARTSAYECLRSTAQWSVRLITGTPPADLGLLKGIVALLMLCQPYHTQPSSIDPSSVAPISSAHDSAEIAPLHHLTVTLCRASRILLGAPIPDIEPTMMEMEDPDLEVFTARTVPALLTTITTWLRSELHQVDWAVTQLKLTTKQELAHREPHDTSDLHQSILVERRICLRLTALAHLMKELLVPYLPKVSVDAVLRAFQDMHRTLGGLTRAKLGCVELPITESYVDCLALVCSDLNSLAYHMLPDIYGKGSIGDPSGDFPANSKLSKTDNKEKGKMGKGGGDSGEFSGSSNRSLLVVRNKAKVMRDSTLVSSLIFQIETSEKYVIMLSNRFKVPLAHYLKRSTARDFRIEVDAIPDVSEICHNRQYPEEEEEEEEDAQVEEVELSDDGGSPVTETMDLLDIDAEHNSDAEVDKIDNEIDIDEENNSEDEDSEDNRFSKLHRSKRARQN
ncbi:hypothetical protein GGF37_000973 [Kickxella alabastrina]|nr:hypothetical protein GGF37_000973 [Kickxella alabastrina]